MKKQSGYSMIELLVVIAIIAILSSMTLFYFKGATAQAKASVIEKAASDMRSIANVAEEQADQKGIYNGTILINNKIVTIVDGSLEAKDTNFTQLLQFDKSKWTFTAGDNGVLTLTLNSVAPEFQKTCEITYTQADDNNDWIVSVPDYPVCGRNGNISTN